MLSRQIPETESFDVGGCYPLTPFAESADLAGGLKRLRGTGAVSVTFVADPLHTPDRDTLVSTFDICLPFKTHFVFDTSLPAQRLGAAHRSNIRRARSCCTFAVVRLADHLSDWVRIYQGLIDSRGITGEARFGPVYFERLAQLSALTTFAAFQDGALIAAALWLRSRDCAYYHLGASLPEGYKAQAMYGLVATAMDHFADCRILHLGGAAGPVDSAANGLSFFKRGFANDTRVAMLCGAILDKGCYAELSARAPATDYFPRYRAPATRPEEESLV